MCFAFNYPSALGVAEKPALAEKMIELAERCAVGFPFIRVDLTITLQNEIKFRSVSFTPGMGIGLFVPKFYDYFYGEKYRCLRPKNVKIKKAETALKSIYIFGNTNPAPYLKKRLEK